MSKDRLGDSQGWLLENAVAGQLGALRRGHVLEFADRVSKSDKTNNGAALSLDWSWYHSRPDKDARHAIRAYLLASLYNNDIAPESIAMVRPKEGSQSNIKAITSRAVLMCGSQMLRPEWGFLSEKATT